MIAIQTLLDRCKLHHRFHKCEEPNCYLSKSREAMRGTKLLLEQERYKQRGQGQQDVRGCDGPLMSVCTSCRDHTTRVKTSILRAGESVCACACVSVRVCVRACVRVARANVDVHVPCANIRECGHECKWSQTRAHWMLVARVLDSVD